MSVFVAERVLVWVGMVICSGNLALNLRLEDFLTIDVGVGVFFLALGGIVAVGFFFGGRRVAVVEDPDQCCPVGRGVMVVVPEVGFQCYGSVLSVYLIVAGDFQAFVLDDLLVGFATAVQRDGVRRIVVLSVGAGGVAADAGDDQQA